LSNRNDPGDARVLPTPEKALAQVRALRYRRRRVRFFDGVLRLAASGAIVVWATFLLDWCLDLPVGVRVVQAVGAVTLIVMALRIFVLSARRPVTDSWLAAQIDSSGDLEQALITAVQLGSGDNPRSKLYSPVLLARTIREAEAKIEAVHAAGLVSGRGLSASTFVLLTALLPAVALGSVESRARRDLSESGRVLQRRRMAAELRLGDRGAGSA